MIRLEEGVLCPRLAQQRRAEVRVLVTGGAGYIGSHMILALEERGYEVVVLDNLRSGHLDAVLAGKLVIGDVNDGRILQQIFSSRSVSAVLHFAGRIQVQESLARPDLYYTDNVEGTLTLLNAMARHRVGVLVLSSSAAVYGAPQEPFINEGHPLHPLSPYGHSKWMAEQMTQDWGRAFDLRYSILRYFNAAGADPLARIGERHEPETHLIPNALRAAQQGSVLNLYGSDYATPDGTCIRDYIHVQDLVDGHLRALEYLLGGEDSNIVNLGGGKGTSNRMVIRTVEQVTGRKVAVSTRPRRPGDPAALVADISKAQALLDWCPQRSTIETIIADAWRWEQERMVALPITALESSVNNL